MVKTNFIRNKKEYIAKKRIKELSKFENSGDEERNVFCSLNGWKEIDGGASHWNPNVSFFKWGNMVKTTFMINKKEYKKKYMKEFSNCENAEQIS